MSNNNFLVMYFLPKQLIISASDNSSTPKIAMEIYRSDGCRLRIALKRSFTLASFLFNVQLIPWLRLNIFNFVFSPAYRIKICSFYSFTTMKTTSAFLYKDLSLLL